MLFRQILTVVLCALLTTSAFAKKPKPPTVEERVGALEEMTLQQQGDIDQNAADIQDLQGGGGGLGWVIMDSDIPPKPVGELLTIFSSAQVSVYLSVNGHGYIQQIASADAFTTNFLGSSYESTDCSGPHYVLLAHVPNRLFGSVYIMGGPTTQRIPYVTDGQAITISRQSFLQNGGTCQALSAANYDAFLLTQIGGDLSETYPPPYSLVKQ